MPKVIIPDKICSHCGKKKVLNSTNFKLRKQLNKSTGKIYTWYSNKCRSCINLDEVRYRLTYDKEKQRRSKRKYEKTEKGKLSRKRYERSEKGKKSRYKQVKKYQRLHPDVVKEWKKRQVKKQVDNLTDPYIKRVLLAKYKDKYKYSELDNPKLIETQRAKIKAYRKYNWSDTYIKGLIQSAIMQDGDKISFNDISNVAVGKYRRGLRRIRYYRELNKLLTVKN